MFKLYKNKNILLELLTSIYTIKRGRTVPKLCACGLPTTAGPVVENPDFYEFMV